jgi:hypothetical protein
VTLSYIYIYIYITRTYVNMCMSRPTHNHTLNRDVAFLKACSGIESESEIDHRTGSMKQNTTDPLSVTDLQPDMDTALTATGTTTKA